MVNDSIVEDNSNDAAVTSPDDKMDLETPPSTKQQEQQQSSQQQRPPQLQVTNLENVMSTNNSNSNISKSAPHKNRQRSESRASLDRATPTNDRAGSVIDLHPFPRGSVIEVWLKEKKMMVHDEDDDWWSGSESSDNDDNEAAVNEANDGDVNNIPSTKNSKRILLADIIDRAVLDNPAGPGASPIYRYYVHYRDLNRRMDEWITVDRIVSPPSIGNAKARALRKLEEKQKKLQQLRHEEERAAAGDNGPRSRRKTGSVAPGSASSAVEDSGGGGRTSRRAARRKDDDDDMTVVASNQMMEEDEKEEAVVVKEAVHTKKEIVELKTDTVTTHTVGEHVVATVHAQELDEHEGMDEASLREHEEVTKVKNVNSLELGEFQMETWYYSPFPKELIGSQGFLDVLYVCEFTFSMFARKCELQRFQSRIAPHERHPPGNEIYRNGKLAMFEVDGQEEKIYCQNLCYIAKLFLDHKTLYFDVDPFLFYVLCEFDNRGFHPVGYFSKEKYSDVGFNLACILSFPSQQRKGYGRFLIAFSYALSQHEEKVGSPEKPMSDLGQQAYKPYWASTIVDFFLNQSDESSLSIMDISKKTSIMAEDIVYTLNMLGILKIINGVYFIAAERSLLTRLAEKYPVKEPRVDPTKLHWTPFLTDIKRDKFSIHAKKPSVETNDATLAETK